MCGKRCRDQFAITDLIRNYSTDNNAKAKSGEACAVDQACFEVREVEVMHPIAENAGADAEPYSPARIAMKPAKSRRFAFGAIASLLT